MPLIKGKHNHRKVYRPPGTRFAEASESWPLRTPKRNPAIQQAQMWAVEFAMRKATFAFFEEFGEFPALETMVVEVACDSFAAYATVYDLREVADDTDDRRS